MQRRSLFVGLSCAALVSQALALQGQPVTIEDRNVGIVVRELTEGFATALDGSPIITITGTPGAAYQLFGGLGTFAGLADVATPFPQVGGAVSAPLILLGPPLFAATTGVFGLMPATGEQDIALTVPVPAGFGSLFLDLQLLLQQPNGALELSNGQLRQIQALPPVPFGWTRNADYPNTTNLGDWIDIEQGDVDGDGDNDTIGVGPTVQLWLNTAGARVQDPAVINGAVVPFLGNGTSAELADLNNDGWLDLAVSFFAGPRYLRVWLNNRETAAGNWAGFIEVPFANIPLIAAANPADLEIGFLNGDGVRDIFLACALDPVTGQRNRVFYGAIIPPGSDIEIAGIVMTDTTAVNLPVIFDDSEDCEIYDFDQDGDNDVVIANFDGDASIFGTGVDYLLVNQGFLQGGVEGVFLAPMPNPLAPVIGDESLDVVVGDIDADGLPDLYFANWALTIPSGSLVTTPFTPVRDRLYLRRGAGLGANYIDFSDALLPDAPAGLGGTDLPNFGTDAEAFDFDFDGDTDIVVPLGTLVPIAGLSLPLGAGTSAGMQVLFNLGITPANLLRMVPFLPPEVLSEDFRDVEPGDWREAAFGFGLYFDKDLGCATGGTSPITGLFSLDHL